MRSRTNARILTVAQIPISSKIQTWISRKFGERPWPILRHCPTWTFNGKICVCRVCCPTWRFGRKPMGVQRLKLGRQTPCWPRFGSQSWRCVFSAKTLHDCVWVDFFWGGPQLYWTFGRHFEILWTLGAIEALKKYIPKQKTRLTPCPFRTLCCWWGVERRILWTIILWSVHWKTPLALTQPLWLAEERSLTDFHCAMAIIFLVLHQCPKEDAPAHPGEIVTVRSLCEAFATSKMTKAGTMWIDVIEEMQFSNANLKNIQNTKILRICRFLHGFYGCWKANG